MDISPLSLGGPKDPAKVANPVGGHRLTLTTEMRDRFDKVEQRIGGIDKRVDGLAYQIDQLDQKLDQHRQETKDGFAATHRFIGGISTTLGGHEERISALEQEDTA